MRYGKVVYNDLVYQVTESEGKVLMPDGMVLEQGDVKWLPPYEANTIFALGLNYADHAKELAFKAPDKPLVFLKSNSTLIGHLSQTPRPSDATYMHYECELAVVIGKTGKNINKEEAYDYIAGYTVANDYAIRDYLENYYRPNLKVKNRDACTPLGPWLVEANDVDDPMNLSLKTYVNGELTQQGNTRDMIFDISILIAYLSEFMTLNLGDTILTGTPEGLIDVKVGDHVVTEIEQIGRLENTIVAFDEFRKQI